MIIGYGIDIMNTARIEMALKRFGKHFIERVYTNHEICQAESRKKYACQVYTAYWAAKEALMKALGTGNRRGVRFRDIEIRHERSGKPYIRLYGVSKECARRLNADNIVVSMSHLHDSAVASVILEDNRGSSGF